LLVRLGTGPHAKALKPTAAASSAPRTAKGSQALRRPRAELPIPREASSATACPPDASPRPGAGLQSRARLRARHVGRPRRGGRAGDALAPAGWLPLPATRARPAMWRGANGSHAQTAALAPRCRGAIEWLGATAPHRARGKPSLPGRATRAREPAPWRGATTGALLAAAAACGAYAQARSRVVVRARTHVSSSAVAWCSGGK